jgi:hypothetical protein
MRRIRHAIERSGMSAVMEQRGGRPRRKRIPPATIALRCRLKHEVYPDFSLRPTFPCAISTSRGANNTRSKSRTTGCG